MREAARAERGLSLDLILSGMLFIGAAALLLLRLKP
jgi:hypothetical protein